jgi:hypothetical protein
VIACTGWMAEWFKAAVLKTALGVPEPLGNALFSAFCAVDSIL